MRFLAAVPWPVFGDSCGAPVAGCSGGALVQRAFSTAHFGAHSALRHSDHQRTGTVLTLEQEAREWEGPLDREWPRATSVPQNQMKMYQRTELQQSDTSPESSSTIGLRLDRFGQPLMDRRVPVSSASVVNEVALPWVHEVGQKMKPSVPLAPRAPRARAEASSFLEDSFASASGTSAAQASGARHPILRRTPPTKRSSDKTEQSRVKGQMQESEDLPLLEAVSDDTDAQLPWLRDFIRSHHRSDVFQGGAGARRSAFQKEGLDEERQSTARVIHGTHDLHDRQRSSQPKRAVNLHVTHSQGVALHEPSQSGHSKDSSNDAPASVQDVDFRAAPSDASGVESDGVEEAVLNAALDTSNAAGQAVAVHAQAADAAQAQADDEDAVKAQAGDGEASDAQAGGAAEAQADNAEGKAGNVAQADGSGVAQEEPSTAGAAAALSGDGAQPDSTDADEAQREHVASDAAGQTGAAGHRAQFSHEERGSLSEGDAGSVAESNARNWTNRSSDQRARRLNRTESRVINKGNDTEAASNNESTAASASGVKASKDAGSDMAKRPLEFVPAIATPDGATDSKSRNVQSGEKSTGTGELPNSATLVPSSAASDNSRRSERDVDVSSSDGRAVSLHPQVDERSTSVDSLAPLPASPNSTSKGDSQSTTEASTLSDAPPSSSTKSPLAVEAPNQTEQEEPAKYNYTRYVSRRLYGFAEGDSTPMADIEVALARCDELGAACGGVTCRESSVETLCTVSAGNELLLSVVGEFAYLRLCAQPSLEKLRLSPVDAVSAMSAYFSCLQSRCQDAERSWLMPENDCNTGEVPDCNTKTAAGFSLARLCPLSCGVCGTSVVAANAGATLKGEGAGSAGDSCLTLSEYTCSEPAFLPAIFGTPCPAEAGPMTCGDSGRCVCADNHCFKAGRCIPGS